MPSLVRNVADWHTNLPPFQGARPDHVRVESSSCCFPRVLWSFDRPRASWRFDPWHVTRSPPIRKRIWVGRYNNDIYPLQGMESDYFEADRDRSASLRLFISCQQTRRQRNPNGWQPKHCHITQVSSFGQAVFASLREIWDVITRSIKNNKAPIIS